MLNCDQVMCHMVGDYILQSDWMATEKTKQHFAAFCHAFVYSCCFLVLKPSLLQWFIIFSTHFFIDRYRLARYIVWVKNYLAPFKSNPDWSVCKNSFGYPPDRPIWLAMWLLIIADNILHILINGIAFNVI